jgi:putative two-component system response regulator
MKTIFIIDDSDTNLTMAEDALADLYKILTMSSAAKMFELLKKIKPGLILLDIEMPVMNGFEACTILKADPSLKEIPVIFLTSRNDSVTEAKGFEIGAVDFITKPFSTPVLLNRIRMHLDIDQLIRDRTSQLRRLQNGIVLVLADMMENRDTSTGGHIVRTTAYIKILLKAMIDNGVYADEMKNWDIDIAISSARLHDIGKIVVSDLILNKPSKLTEEEYESMKPHAAEGERIIDQIIEQTGEGEFLRHAKLFAGYHHERWDGTGYPYGLKGTDIPLQGRIMTVVDVYDALVSKRSYKAAFTDDEAVDIIMSNAGKQYDPRITDAFYTVRELFKEATVCLRE